GKIQDGKCDLTFYAAPLEIETTSTTWSCVDRGGGDGIRIDRSDRTMDGQTAGDLGGQHPEGRDLRGRSSPEARAHGRGGRGLAGEVSAGGRERAADEAEGRRGTEGGVGQEAQAEDWRACARP